MIPNRSRLEQRLARGRQAAAVIHVDTCRITTPASPAGPLDRDTAAYPSSEPVVVYEGPCRIPQITSAAAVTTRGGAETSWEVGEYPLSLPIDAPGSADVTAGMTVTYLTAAYDSAMVDLVFGIVEPLHQSLATARRFKMKRVVSGGAR